MTEYWLISVPGNPAPNDSWEELVEKTAHLSSHAKFVIPELKVSLYSSTSNSATPFLALLYVLHSDIGIGNKVLYCIL